MKTFTSLSGQPVAARLALARLLLGLALLGFAAAPTHAQTVQLSGVASYRSGGSFSLPTTGLVVRLDPKLAVGGAVDLAIHPTWRLELAYSRQPTKVDGPFGARLGVTVENYLAGLQEERGAADQTKSRPFGTLLVGATRVVPDFGAGAKTFPAAGLALGTKYFPTKNVGLRLEGRGIMTFTTTSGGALCGSGLCYLNYSGSSFWQWDFGGGLVLAF